MKLNDIGEFVMKFSYKKLWRLLIDRYIKHKEHGLVEVHFIN